MAEKVLDVVCGMEVDPEATSMKSDYKGTTYYFCSLGCKIAFDEEPELYLHDDEEAHVHH